jgi:hypothetical protein
METGERLISSKRGMSAVVIASICLMSALLQFVAALLLFEDSMGRRMLPSLGLSVVLYLATGIAVYLVRIEALACLACLLARRLAMAVGSPIQTIPVLDLLFLLVLLYFTMRLFQPPAARRFTMVLIGLTLGHLSILLANLQFYPVLVSTGSKSPLTVLAALLGCGALYAGVLAMRSRPEWARKFFLFAAFAMGMTLPAWGLRYGFPAPFWLGVPVALFGFGLTRHPSAKPAQVSAH